MKQSKRHTKQHNSNDSYIYLLHKKEIKQMNALKDRIIALTKNTNTIFWGYQPLSSRYVSVCMSEQ